jgi:hypothetical protein
MSLVGHRSLLRRVPASVSAACEAAAPALGQGYGSLPFQVRPLAVSALDQSWSQPFDFDFGSVSFDPLQAPLGTELLDLALQPLDLSNGFLPGEVVNRSRMGRLDRLKGRPTFSEAAKLDRLFPA